jgi:hypothetical protein
MNEPQSQTTSSQLQPVSVPGFESQRIAVQTGGAFGTSKLWVNGQLAPSAAKKGRYLLRRDNGTEAEAYFKGGFPDPTPVLVVGDQKIRFAAPLAWYEWAWAAFPLVLIFLGGAIGGGLGAVAATFNVGLFRSEKPVFVKYALSAAISFAAFFIWVLIVSAIQRR